MTYGENNQTVEQHFSIQSLKHLFPEAEFEQISAEGNLWYVVECEPGGFVRVRVAPDGTTTIYNG